MEKVRPKGKNALSQIRTSPPTPQCFFATRGTTGKTPAKETRSRLMVTYWSQSCLSTVSSLHNCASYLSTEESSKRRKKRRMKLFNEYSEKEDTCNDVFVWNMGQYHHHTHFKILILRSIY